MLADVQSRSGKLGNIAILCQWFPPEVAPIGVMLDEIAVELSQSGYNVSIVTGFPNYPDGKLFPGYRRRLQDVEETANYSIIRCYESLPNSRSVISKLFNFLTFQLSSLIALLRMRNLDLIYVVSPPLSNAGTALLRSWFGSTKYLLNVQDIYPEAAIRSGVIRNKYLIRMLTWFERRVYEKASGIIAIGTRFADRVEKTGVQSKKLHIVRNWIDLGEVVPVPKRNEFSVEHKLHDRFVVLYSGTLGRVSGVEILIDCAVRLGEYTDLIFLIIGEGAVKHDLVSRVARDGLDNVLFLPFQDRSRLSEVQATADVSIVTMKKDHGYTSIPSKVLGYMAAARPVIVSADDDTDIADLVIESRSGVVVQAEHVEELTAAILSARENRQMFLEYGKNGRRYLEENLQRDVSVKNIRKVVELCLT